MLLNNIIIQMKSLRIKAYITIGLFLTSILVLLILAFIYLYSNLSIFIIVLTFAFIVTVIFSFVVFASKRQPIIKLSWIFAFICFPIISCLVFMFVGIRPYTTKNLSNMNNLYNDYAKYDLKKDIDLKKFDPSFAKIIEYNKKTSKTNICDNNEIKIIEDFYSLYIESIKLIRSAKKCINIQMYTINDGIWLRIIATELLKKKKEGVNINIIYDWVGCFKRPIKKIINQLMEAGCNIAIFNYPGIMFFKSSTNYRSHRKSIIIDNNIALYGSSNISDEYLSISDKLSYWHDQNYIVKGEIVNSLAVHFYYDLCTFCNVVNKKKMTQNLVSILNKQMVDVLSMSDQVKDKTYMQLVSSAPDNDHKTIEQILTNLIHSAKKSIYIVTPYLVPTRIIIESLICSSISGVDVKLIVPGWNDNKKLTIRYNEKCYQILLESLCSVYEYQGFIHSKYLIIDDKIVFTGSNNLDYRSLWINFENAILVHDRLFANQMKELFEGDLNLSKKIDLSEVIAKNTHWRKFKDLFLDIVQPLM